MKTIQTTNTEIDLNNIENKSLGLFISCVKCGTGRNFIIEENLKLIKDLKSNSFSIETSCEKCFNVILIGIGWIEGGMGYSHKKYDFGKGYQVIDENGLSDLS
jgi:hypothetical protein